MYNVLIQLPRKITDEINAITQKVLMEAKLKIENILIPQLVGTKHVNQKEYKVLILEEVADANKAMLSRTVSTHSRN